MSVCSFWTPETQNSSTSPPVPFHGLATSNRVSRCSSLLPTYLAFLWADMAATNVLWSPSVRLPPFLRCLFLPVLSPFFYCSLGSRSRSLLIGLTSPIRLRRWISKTRFSTPDGDAFFAPVAQRQSYKSKNECDSRRARLRISVAINQNFALMITIACTGGKRRFSDNLLC